MTSCPKVALLLMLLLSVSDLRNFFLDDLDTGAGDLGI